MLLAMRTGDLDAAEREYRIALDLAPYFVPAYVDLADAQRLRGRDDQAEQTLGRGLTIASESAEPLLRVPPTGFYLGREELL